MPATASATCSSFRYTATCRPRSAPDWTSPSAASCIRVWMSSMILPLLVAGQLKDETLRRLTVERLSLGLDLFLCLAFGPQHGEGDGYRHDDQSGSDPESQVVAARQRRRGGLTAPYQPVT